MALPAAAPSLLAQEPPSPPGWSDTGEFSYVMTSGNSETSTLGLKNLLKRTFDSSSFEIRAGAIRAETTTKTRIVVAGPAVQEDSSTATSAENYYLNGRFDRKISEKFFWYGGVGWDRNQFAGIDNRYAVMGGVGNIWSNTDTLKFRTDYALTYTKEEDVVPNPDVKDKFGGVRFSWNYLHKFGDSTTYGNDFIVDENLNDTQDYRGDMTNWVAVAMSKRLALKVSLQWLYDHQPALVEVTDPNGVLPSQLVPLETLDTIFTTSLVVKF
jgi:putative salt-induced outer membrane protein YdiY